MIQRRKGQYVLAKTSVELFAPRQQGVYYLGYLNSLKEFVPLYIASATGGTKNIKDAIIQNLKDPKWTLEHKKWLTHFSFRVCGSFHEAKALEKCEVEKYNPKYNSTTEETIPAYMVSHDYKNLAQKI